MERKIGEIFELGGEWYQCIIGHCNQCSFDEAGTCKFIGNPYCAYRNDKKLACFKKLEKVGEPYEFQKRIIQAYKLYTTPFISVNMDFVFIYLNGSSTINIIIKQNKEDMENNNNEAKLSNFEKIGKNLKEFDLEAAKSGKPVCTRDGRKARIICFDQKDIAPIVGLVTGLDGKESIYAFYKDGRVSSQEERVDDLMMLSEKKEGWVNVYSNCLGGPYESEEYALKQKMKDCIDTVKITWEE